MRRENVAFCIACGSKKHYTINNSRKELTIRGIHFSYVEKMAFCKECGEEIYVPEISDENAHAREDAYREAAGLITVSQIKEIMEKYNIGAGPLAKIVGFGEITINRYLNGQLPSQMHSDLLLEIKKSYKKMECYLNENGSKISDVASNKCRAAIEKLKDIYSTGKIESVTRYLLTKDTDVTPMSLQKMLYYAQAFYKALFDTPLFTDRCEAWARGPVYRDVYCKYREFGYDPIKLPNLEFDVEESGLTIAEISFLDAIIDAFGRYSGSTLSYMTHSERPWLEARGTLLPRDRCSNVLSNRTIDAYFKEIVEKYHMVNPRDIAQYSQDMAGKIFNSRSC